MKFSKNKFDEQPWWTFGILSPVSELVWVLEVLSSPVLMSLSVDFTEKNKRVISDFSVQQLQIKQQRKKNCRIFPSFPQPSCVTAEEFPALRVSPSNTDGQSYQPF